jgi:hypothetical protein
MFCLKLSQSPECGRCGEVETIKHQFYQCYSAFNTWKCDNKILDEIGFGDRKVETMLMFYLQMHLSMKSLKPSKP